MDNKYAYLTPDCPVCGHNPAIMSSTTWRPFDGQACGDICGLLAGAAVQAVQQSDEFKRLTRRVQNDMLQLSVMEHQAVIESGDKLRADTRAHIRGER